MLRKVYRVIRQSRWPYERVLDLEIVPEQSPIRLHIDGRIAASRIYLQHPATFVEWAVLVNDWLDHGGEDSTDMMQLEDVGDDIWLHVGYWLFSSDRREDDKQLSLLRAILRSQGLKGLALPDVCPIQGFVISGENSESSDQLSNLQVNATFEKRTTNQLIVSDTENSRIPIVNSHTIPEDLANDFEFVYAGVITLEKIKQLPSHQQLISNLENHLQWFQCINR